VNGSGSRDWFEHDGDLDPLRSHPRFAQLLARLDGHGPAPPAVQGGAG